MNSQEFKEFCHLEFTKRGFVKKKSMYYLKGKDLLCGLYLQRSMSEAYYVNFYYFIGNYENVEIYPKLYNADVYQRIVVLSKNTIKGESFMTSVIDFEQYTVDDIKPYFDLAFDDYIMPPILQGKKIILDKKDYYFEGDLPTDVSRVIEKIRQGTVPCLDKEK